MLLKTGLVVVCVLVPGVVFAELPTSERESVQTAIERYDAAIAEARDAFLADLEEAKRDAIADDDLDAAEQIAELKVSAEGHSAGDLFDRYLTWRRLIRGTTWRRPSGRRTTFAGDGWVVVDEHRVANYIEKSQNIYIWIFDEDLEAGILRRFVPDTKWTIEHVERVGQSE